MCVQDADRDGVAVGVAVGERVELAVAVGVDIGLAVAVLVELAECVAAGLAVAVEVAAGVPGTVPEVDGETRVGAALAVAVELPSRTSLPCDAPPTSNAVRPEIGSPPEYNVKIDMTSGVATKNAQIRSRTGLPLPLRTGAELSGETPTPGNST